MDVLIWLGAALSLAGLAGIIWCMVVIWRAKRAQERDDVLRDRIRKLIPVNAGALFLSVFGLMLVVIGVMLSA